MERERIYGWHAVQAAIERADDRVEALWLAEGRRGPRLKALLKAAQAARIEPKYVSRAELDRMVEGNPHQGVVADYRLQAAPAPGDLSEFLMRLAAPAFLLVLDGVQDPHNLGACLRSACAAGAQALIVPRDNAVAVTAAVRKVASGAAESVPVFTVANLARALERLREAGIWVVGASAEADKSLYEVDLSGPLALVLGGEGEGLRRLTREHCDVLAAIPMAGSVTSLNVSNAAAVCLFEALRQRRARWPGLLNVP